jgi:hypothetical protein
MGLQFPHDLKVLDFFTSLIYKFNLVVEPIVGRRNALKIEPFNDWVDAGAIVNWSDKVDHNVKYEIRHPLGDQPKTLIFTDKLDEDVINQYQNVTFKNTFGERKYESDSDLTDGEKKIETVFGATPVKVIPNAQTVVVPFLYRQQEGKYGQPFKFAPRLLFKQAKQTTTATEAYGIVSGSSGYFYMFDGTTTFPINYYRTLGPNTTKNVNFNTGFDIHYNNLNYYPYQQNFVNGRTKNDAYTNYWSFYINELYDVDTRLVTLNVVLNPDEIQNLQLNSKIFIDGHYYRINKIQGANLIERQSTQVELLKTLPRKLFYPRRRIYFEPNQYKDVVQNDENENGTTSYSTYTDSIPVSESIIITQAATRDNNLVFSESVVWDYVKPVIFNNKITTIGTADYDETSNNVLVLGNTISVPQQTNNVGILAPSREQSVYKSNTIYAGATVIQSRTATDYKVLQLSASAEYRITSSTEEYPYYLAHFSGSGTGTNYVFLPDANDLDGVAYQFQLSSSYTSSRSLTVAASGSQLIGPTDSVALTITGSLYEFKALNGNWVNSVNPGSATGGGTISTASFISVYSTSSQTVTAPESASIMTFDTVDFSRGIALSSGSRFLVSKTGAYNLAFSAQLDKTTGTKQTAHIWLKKNGANVPNSNTKVTMGGGSGDKAVAAWNLFLTGSAGDYWELAWSATDTNVFLSTEASSSVYPVTPSIIATVNSMY